MITKYEDTNDFIPVAEDDLVIGQDYVIPSRLMLPGSKKVWFNVTLVKFAAAPGGVKCAVITYAEGHPLTTRSRCSLNRLHILQPGTCTQIGEIENIKKKRPAAKKGKERKLTDRDMDLLF